MNANPTVPTTRWTDYERADWRDLLEYMAVELPLPHPVTVRFVRWSGKDGEAGWDGTRFTIYIARRLSFSEAYYTLIEEWAHCMAGITGRDDKDHSDYWGIAYATARRAADTWFADR